MLNFRCLSQQKYQLVSVETIFLFLSTKIPKPLETAWSFGLERKKFYSKHESRSLSVGLHFQPGWGIFRLVVLLFLFSASFKQVRSQEFSYQQYSIPQGLAQTQVLSLFEDSKGYLWIGTKGGVSIFNYQEFRNLSLKDGLLSNAIVGICEDKNGLIYLSHLNGVSIVLSDTILTFPILKKGFGLQTIYFDQTHSPVIICLNSFNQRYVDFTIGQSSLVETNKLSGLISYPSEGLTSEKNGRAELIYDPATHELICLYPSGIIRSFRNDSLLWTCDSLFFQDIYLSESGKLFGIAKRKLFQVEKGRIEFVITLPADYLFNDNLHVDKSGKAIYFDSHLNIFNGEFFHDTFDFRSIVIVSYMARSGFWIGTEGNGLFKLKSQAFVHYLPSKNQVLNNIWSIIEDRNHRIWFSSYNEGFAYLDRNELKTDNRYLNLNILHDVYLYMGSNYHPSGDILFAHSGLSLIRYDSENFYEFFQVKPNCASFYVVADTIRKKILAGTNLGLIISDYSGESYEMEDLFVGQNRNVVSISIDKNGHYLLGGFTGNVLYLPDTKEQKLIDGLDPDFGIIAQCFDDYGNLWIGNRTGLYVYTGDTVYSILSEVFSSHVTDLQIYGKDTLLIGAINGFGMFNIALWQQNRLEQLSFFTNQNGFEGIECGQNGMFIDSKKKVWINTSDRVVCFDPKRLRNDSTLQLFIETLEISQTSGESKVEKFPDIITIRSDEEATIVLAATGISDLSNIRFFAEIKDKSSRLVFSSQKRAFTLFGFKPGEYNLTVSAEKLGFENVGTEITIPIQILPLYYQTFWFRFVSSALGIVLISLIAGRVSKHRRKKELKEIETEKYIQELQLKTLLGQLNPHFVFNTINSIGASIYSENKEKAYEILQKFSKLIRSSLVSGNVLIHSLAQEFELVSDYLDIEKSRFPEKVYYQIHVDPSIDLRFKIPKLLLQNFAENALKHGILPSDKACLLLLEAKQNDNEIRIIIEDDGIGREAASKLNLNSTRKGMSVIRESIDLYNQANQEKIQIEISDLRDDKSNPLGTRIEITIPVHYQYQT